MCFPGKSKHTHSSANHTVSSHLCAGASFRPGEQMVTSSRRGYFGVSLGIDSHTHYKPVLGPDKLSYVLDHIGSGENTFYVEGLAFPDAGFSGLVSISASLLQAPHKVREVCPIPCKVPQWRCLQPPLLGVLPLAEFTRHPDFHGYGGFPCGTLDNDTQHPAAFGGFCLQVGEMLPHRSPALGDSPRSFLPSSLCSGYRVSRPLCTLYWR